MTKKSRSRSIAGRVVSAGGRPRHPGARLRGMGPRRITTSARSGPGQVYRSGQMPASALAQTIRERQIKTVLNLRGPNPSESCIATSSRQPSNRDRRTSTSPCRHACGWSRAQLRAWSRTFEQGRIPLADPLRMGVRAHGPCLRIRRVAAARQHASTTLAPSFRSATCRARR